MNVRSRMSGVAALSILACGVTVIAPAPAEARNVKVKLGTLAPEGSPWFNTLGRIGQGWKKASDGKVRLKIYPGGVAGDEGDTLRKLRIGQLQAATITGIGLGRLTRSTIALQVPMMLESYEELDYVRERLSPKIEAELLKAGVVVLNWGDAGWVHFFSKEPAQTPDDFRKMKLFVSAGDPAAERAWRKAKFDPVPMSATDVLSGLQTGLIDSFSTTPLYALTSQWFGLAKHMVRVNWTPLNGATIIDRRTWEKIDPALRSELMKIARDEGNKMQGEVRKLGDEAIKAMQDRGLEVVEPSPALIDGWRTTAKMAYPAIRGEVVPADIFDEVRRLVQEYREKQKR